MDKTNTGNSNRKFLERTIRWSFITIYVIILLILTVFSRAISYSTPRTTLFWSYGEWINGNWNIGLQIILNIVMFIPVGFIVSSLNKRSSIIIAIASALFLSAIIESLQLYFHRGLFELDDILNNSLGAFIGWLFHRWVKKFSSKYTLAIEISFVFICIFAFSLFLNKADMNVENIYCFQVDNVHDGVMIGFAFMYQDENRDLNIYLQSNTGKTIQLMTDYYIPRDDVNKYFNCNRDYSRVGFRTLLDNMDYEEEYEIIVNFGRLFEFKTGVYITGNRIHYVKDSEFEKPIINNDIVEKGILRVYRPDFHCWIYQYDNSLYWIADENFAFENDGSTNIQYHLWTTQEDRLPVHRLINNWFWDNISGNFEDYEVLGNFGSYRIMKRELPTEYSIKSIETGYFKDGIWIWRDFFRPIYQF